MKPSTSINGVRQWRRYEPRKATGLSWLGDLPSHWQTKRLKHVCRMNPSKSEIRGLMDDLPVSFLPMEKVSEQGGLDLELTKPIGVLWQGFTYFRNGDVLVAKITPCFENGKGALANGLENGVGFGTTELHVLRPLPLMEPRFLELVTRQYSFRRLGCMSMTGVAGQQRVSEAFISNFVVGVPPLDEQRRIIGFLDRETAKIDALIAKKERLIELLQEKRTALISHAVIRGLDPNVPVKDSGVEWQGKIPAHWTPKKLKYLFRFAKRLNHPNLTVLSVYRDYGVIEKTTRDDNHNKTPEDLTTYQLVNVGDLVINKMKAWQGSLGISSLHGITSPDYVVYRSTNKEHLPYLHHRLRIPGMASTYHCISNGIRPDQWRLEPEKFEQLWLFLPPAEEQKTICEHIDRQIAAIDGLRTRVREAIDKLREYRTALISAAVTGKIDVREEVT